MVRTSALVALVACAREPAVTHEPAPAAAPQPVVVRDPDTPPPPPCADLGTLTVCGERYEAPSHGGEEFVRNAHYTVENTGDAPAVLEILGLVVGDEHGTRLPLAIDTVAWSGGRAGTQQTIAPRERVGIRIFGRGSIAKLRYHVVYHHEVKFGAGGAQGVVEAGALYFRYPHRL